MLIRQYSSSCSLVFLISRPQPRSTLFPYTTLFRSHDDVVLALRHWLDRQPRALLRDDHVLEPFGRLQRLQRDDRSEEHTSELQSRRELVCRLLLEKKKHNRSEPATLIAQAQPLGQT